MTASSRHTATDLAGNMATYPAVRSCLEQSVERDPGFASAWAMLAFAHLDAVRFGLVEPSRRAGELQSGLVAAQRAVELASQSVLALQSLAAVRYMSGDAAEAERIQRKAIALNPQNPESLAQLGWRLTVQGRWQEGTALLQNAIDRSVAVPNWYHTSLAVGLYLGGEPTARATRLKPARSSAVASDRPCWRSPRPQVGHAQAARIALYQAVAQAPRLGRDSRAFWATFLVADAVVDRLDDGLRRAGLVVAAVEIMRRRPDVAFPIRQRHDARPASALTGSAVLRRSWSPTWP